jgi:hypothetical protein
VRIVSEGAKQTLAERLRVLANLKYQARPAAVAMNKAADELERLQAVAPARVMAMEDEPDFAERHVQLGKFYSAKNTDELIDRMEGHILRLQEKVQMMTYPQPSARPQRVREG